MTTHVPTAEMCTGVFKRSISFTRACLAAELLEGMLHGLWVQIHRALYLPVGLCYFADAYPPS